MTKVLLKAFQVAFDTLKLRRRNLIFGKLEVEPNRRTRVEPLKYLIICSYSAQWKSYFEEEVIPSFARNAKIINLSRDGGRKNGGTLIGFYIGIV